MPTFHNDICWLKVHGEPNPLFLFCVHFAKITIYSLHRAMPINPLLLQECYPYSMPGNIILQLRAADL